MALKSSFGLLLSQDFCRHTKYVDCLKEIAVRHKVKLNIHQLPMQKEHEPQYKSWELYNVLDEHVLQDIDAAFITEDTVLKWGTFRRFFGALALAPKCKWIQISWIGMDFPSFEPIKKKENIVITNGAGTNAKPIATTVMGSILNFNRGFYLWRNAQEKKEWLDRSTIPDRVDLDDQTVLCFGYGNIGNAIGKMCKSFGMKVIGVKRTIPSSSDDESFIYADKLITPSDMELFVPKADYVVISSPLTEETRNIFDKKMLSLMKTSSFLINVGRGQIVDEPALIEILKQNKIGGAFLDVFHNEPLEKDSILWELPNVIIAPHDSATCINNVDRAFEVFRENFTNRMKYLDHDDEYHKYLKNVIYVKN